MLKSRACASTPRRTPWRSRLLLARPSSRCRTVSVRGGPAAVRCCWCWRWCWRCSSAVAPTGSGWARYTSTPGVLGMAQAEAEAKLEAAGLEVEYADPAYSETVPDGAGDQTDPGPASGCSTAAPSRVTVSLGKERYDVPRLRGRTEDQAQDALLEAEARLRRDRAALLGDGARGPGHRQPAQGRDHAEARRPVDLVVSKGRRPIKVGDWVGKDADDATATLEARGLVVKVDRRGVQRHRRRGRRDQPGPHRRHAVQGRRGRVHRLARAGAGRGARPSAGFGRRRRHGAARGPRLRGRGRLDRSPTRSASCSVPTRAAGEQVPKGSTITLIVV